ncbi:acyl carrier protein [Spiroplasma eriocheiris]|uniref:Putative acyl carrier protein n=1 Tax=Spiroplasma eriocheiris TaxID=315358 RepID=A0A0H3XIE4_9MOLU|nr:phosphopantetheine-binding protein [Spiroplasma eriocheiris]AHF58218.1 putative acyl carrier protein [Spiroplasma eriocheiris CCTCC M 207170]AKM54653.1 putative acyl carrier protein [Spiroplasma eriocheiris]
MNIMEELKKVLKQRGISKTVDLNTNFKDLGLDSLDLMDLVILAEEKLSIRIPDDKLTEIKTVNDLVKIIDDLKK